MPSPALRPPPRDFSAPAILRFQRPDDTTPDDRLLTVRAAFDKFLRPHLQHRSPAHLTKYATCLSHWERLTPNSPLWELQQEEPLLAFREAMQATLKIKPITANTYVQYICAILNVCGPRHHHNRRGRDVIDRVPFIDSIPVAQKRPRVATHAELNPIYEACKVATWPKNRRLPAPLWWQTLYTLAYTYGPRTNDLAPLKVKGTGMAWAAITTDAACPVAEIELEHALGWIIYTPAKTARDKPELILPMTAVVRNHLDRVPKLGTLILPCTTHYLDFRAQRKLIEQAAGIERDITLQLLRKTCSSYWHRVSPTLGDYVTGHAARGVNATFYREPLITWLEPDPQGNRLIDRFKYPEAMLAGPK